ncbi:MAG: Asp23/Gls24 family envelope stress response protein [Clostridia bacterium]
MPGTIKNELGKIVISESIIARIAGHAAVENYGIVGMNSKSTTESILKLVSDNDYKRGVKVTPISDDSYDIDLYVNLVYGVSLPAVAKNIMTNVRYRVEELTGIKINNLHIHVDSIDA